jgi:ATPase family associated with various cellular activities (AAA)
VLCCTLANASDSHARQMQSAQQPCDIVYTCMIKLADVAHALCGIFVLLLTDDHTCVVLLCVVHALQTLLANAIAGELGVSFVKISAPEIVSGMSGESEQKVTT